MWKKLKDFGGEVGRAWVHYECNSLAAGVAFYAGLSIFPLMLVLMAGLGAFFAFMQAGQDALDSILGTVSQQFSPQMAEALDAVLSDVQDRALVNGPLAFAGLLLTASLVFARIDRGFARIWDVRLRTNNQGFWAAVKKVLLNRGRSLVMLGAVGLLVVGVFGAGLFLRASAAITRKWFPDVPFLPGAGSLLLGMAANLLTFSLLYRFLSKEPVAWRLCFQAGAVAALLWEGGSHSLGLVSFGDHFTAYGMVGSFLLVQLWIYYNVMVLFAGALIVRIGTRPINSKVS